MARRARTRRYTCSAPPRGGDNDETQPPARTFQKTYTRSSPVRAGPTGPTISRRNETGRPRPTARRSPLPGNDRLPFHCHRCQARRLGLSPCVRIGDRQPHCCAISVRNCPPDIGDAANELTPHARDSSSGRKGRWPYCSSKQSLLAVSTKPGRLFCTELSPWFRGTIPRSKQETRHQSNLWGLFSRAEYEARVTMAKTIPAMTLAGSCAPVGPMSSGRTPIPDIADRGMSSTYARSRAPSSAGATPNLTKGDAGSKPVAETSSWSARLAPCDYKSGTGRPGPTDA